MSRTVAGAKLQTVEARQKSHHPGLHPSETAGSWKATKRKSSEVDKCVQCRLRLETNSMKKETAAQSRLLRRPAVVGARLSGRREIIGHFHIVQTSSSSTPRPWPPTQVMHQYSRRNARIFENFPDLGRTKCAW